MDLTLEIVSADGSTIDLQIVGTSAAAAARGGAVP